jgi:hypothetical protein
MSYVSLAELLNAGRVLRDSVGNLLFRMVWWIEVNADASGE